MVHECNVSHDIARWTYSLKTWEIILDTKGEIWAKISTVKLTPCVTTQSNKDVAPIYVKNMQKHQQRAKTLHLATSKQQHSPTVATSFDWRF